MTAALQRWKKNWSLLPVLFNHDEIADIKARLKKLKIKNIVYCSFENRLAKSGGLAAVTTQVLPFLKETNSIPNVALITPYYSRISNQSALRSTGVRFSIPFGKKNVPVEILEYQWNYTRPQKGGLKEYYIKAEGFFNSHNRVNDPYIYSENDRDANDAAILKNALFYCKAVPPALQKLGIVDHTVLHLQDWQTALLSLTAKEAMLGGVLNSCGTVQTLHNSFDAAVPFTLLAPVCSPQRIKKLQSVFADLPTVLQLGLQLTDGPLNTVSNNFAAEFTADVLQTQHFAPHLQDIFTNNGVFGVNNGMFVDFSGEFAAKKSFTLNEIKQIKLKKRKALLQILDEYRPKERFGELTYQGRSITTLPDNIPIIVMSGRLDPVQKGYDILLRVIDRFKADELKAILTPMAIRPSDLDIFRKSTKTGSGNLTVFPVRMQKGFHELQVGSTFGIMPSIYEPFGAAIEYMVNGTVNIARATGGLVDQIDAEKCGLLYRETDRNYDLKNIKHYANTGDTVSERDTNAWVQDMVDELYKTLQSAIALYRKQPNEYYKMINRGFAKARKFGWDTNARRYNRLFQKVNKGF